ncbi:transcriptional regulator [Streptomyces sp. TRM43335]|uniref:Transcriptional regulator n=1 Tax=Streptomyces taklimakanensis TaxID=2569853 RepID=A0A6G2BD25_9ACTN|nr:transcriptional regulator [Streptomyces taklimakanensis]
MTRMDSVRSATDNARDTVRHAAEAVAPKVALAAGQAKSTVYGQYAAHVGPRLAQARETLPPAVDLAAARAAQRTREAARMAGEYTAPRVEAARAAAGPVREAAMARSTAAVAALRGELTAADIRRLARRKARRARTGRAFRKLAVVGVVAGGAAAVWKWWERQSSPDWLVEPPAATEVGGGEALMEGGGDEGGGALEPEAEAGATRKAGAGATDSDAVSDAEAAEAATAPADEER